MNPDDIKPTVPQPTLPEQPAQPQPPTTPAAQVSEPTAPVYAAQPTADPTPAMPAAGPTQQIPLAAPSTEPLPPGLSQLKSVFLKILVACLIASATVAVTAILAGGLGDVGGKALGTIFVVGLHALIALGFIGMDGTHTEDGNLKVFANVVFGIIVASFITSTLGVWEIMPGEWVWKLYASYGILAVAILHGEMLARILGHQKLTDNIVYANFVVMVLVVLMLFALIFVPDISTLMGAVFFRPLAALAVIDGTLTLVAVILDRLYLSKHPELVTANSIVTKNKSAGPRIFVVIVIILLGLQIIPALLFALVGGLFY